MFSLILETSVQSSNNALAMYIFLLPLAVSIAYVIYQRFLSPLAGIPGPLSASLSRLWITNASRAGRFHVVIQDLHKKHGKVVRIGPNEVYVDPNLCCYSILTLLQKCRRCRCVQTHICNRNQVSQVQLVQCVAGSSEIRLVSRTR